MKKINKAIRLNLFRIRLWYTLRWDGNYPEAEDPHNWTLPKLTVSKDERI